MSWINFKNYQETAIDELRDKVNSLIKKEGNKICVFKAPTGSGKTLMMAEWMMRFCDPYSRNDGRTFSFVWIAVNKLHDQSHDSLKKFYELKGMGLRCSYFHELEDRKIKQNEILFLNWASINNEDKVIVRANEKDNNLSSVIDRTKEAGRTIILIIDESHHTAKSENSKALINNLDPKITIEVSATPELSDFDERVTVDIEDVKAEGMIKKEIVVNPGFKNYVVDLKKNDQTADELILKSALQKRIDLKKKLEKEGSNVNPLLLIQLPDTKKGVPDKKEDIENLLAKFGYTTKNGKLAIYLSEKDNKINLANIEKNENEVEVMMFKQAIALGWDCPRATILVLFRQWKDETMTFSIQTLGRIMRMPEQKHYKDQELNIAYLYTSLQDINTRILKGASSGIKPLTSYRENDKYKSIDLVSYHSKRFREETRLSSDFVPIFLEAAKKTSLKNVSLRGGVVKTTIIKDGRVENADKEITKIEGGSFEIPKTETELQYAFDMFVLDNLQPDFAPETRSIKRINDSIYTFFNARRNEDEWPKIQATILSSEKNRQAVIDTINLAKDLYKTEVGKGKRELIQNEEPWNIPEAINFEPTFAEQKYKKSIMQPYYARTRDEGGKLFEDSDIENDFIKYLENSKQVVWWFRNGKQDGTFFAVPHIEHGQEKPFYVDFVVMLKNGTIGLFDTKSGYTAELAKSRSEGLVKYITEQKKKGKKIDGGIVRHEKKSWLYFTDKEYKYNPNDIKGWEFLNLN
jgi:type III restriction enzyme